MSRSGRADGQARAICQRVSGLLAPGRSLQSLVEVAVDKNSAVVFPAPLMSTIAELGAFLARETKAASELPAAPDPTKGSTNGELLSHDRHQPA